jgi:hypothetical protein
MRRISKRQLIKLIGDPSKLAEELRAFSRNNASLSVQVKRLTEKFPNMWVAFLCDRPVALGTSLTRLFEETDRQKLPRESLCVKFLERRPRTLILGAKSRRP